MSLEVLPNELVNFFALINQWCWQAHDFGAESQPIKFASHVRLTKAENGFDTAPMHSNMPVHVPIQGMPACFLLHARGFVLFG